MIAAFNVIRPRIVTTRTSGGQMAPSFASCDDFNPRWSRVGQGDDQAPRRRKIFESVRRYRLTVYPDLGRPRCAVRHDMGTARSPRFDDNGRGGAFANPASRRKP